MSSVDWPDELAAVLFLQGCPWRCAYCHNQHLLPAEGDSALTWAEVADFLASRVGLLDGVVFSGGEPLAQAAVAEAIAEARSLGLRVALHTGGVMPERFAELLPMLSWVGFDVKAPFGDYERVTGVAGSGERALESLRALVASGVPFEARTTVHADLLSADDLRQMGAELAAEGVTVWILQPFRTDGSPLELPHSTIDFEDLAEELRELVPGIAVR
ncbi:MAG TPA: anaerobic ribonucleoside-triphosphate reductase activating protein [Coriobacteriia bacterium]|nr:anaerobic ribonucleoside-triphosphate reductase activating protein [Coriobacteriia bacterium]